ncbi:MAG: DegT/DnrJ/EryC1/StrS family aminotransferase [Xanthobacteraceae bacterium]
MTQIAKKPKSPARAPVFKKPLEIVRPRLPPLDAIADKFNRALTSGQVTNNGPWVIEFERRLEDYIGVPTLVFSSGQAALLAMLYAAEVRGGEVIVPAFTFAATPHAVVWSGAEPIFADIKDDMSFGLDPTDVERRITERTVAILAVDPYGIACDYAALTVIAKRHNCKLLVDSAPAFGTQMAGRQIGGFGDAQIFSFHASKAFNTMEGGCLCTRDTILIESARAIRNFGQASGDCPFVGFNGKMMEISALIGLEQLKTFDVAGATRRLAAERITASLRQIAGLAPAQAPMGQLPIWLYLPVIVEPAEFGGDRDEVCELLSRENLNVRKYYSPACHQLSVYATMRKQPVLANAERAARNVLALPIYNDMTEEECGGIIEAFRRAAQTLKATRR